MRTEILMAVYNGEAFLAEQIDSLLSQDTSDWHLTISDDKSSDKSMEIAQQYIERFPDKISRVFPPHRFGNARDHFFWLMKNCEADYILFCDQDDVWHSDKVRKTVEALKAAEAEYGPEMPVLVFTDQTVVDEKLRTIAPSLMHLQKQDPYAQDYRNLLIKNVVTGCTVGINRPLADLAGQCTAPEKTIVHDWWLGLVAARFGKMVYLDESTMEYRQHGHNSVGAKDVKKLSYVLDKFLHPQKIKAHVATKKAQAGVFQETYCDELEKDENFSLVEFSKEKTCFKVKLEFFEYIPSLLRKGFFFYRW